MKTIKVCQKRVVVVESHDVNAFIPAVRQNPMSDKPAASAAAHVENRDSTLSIILR